MSTSKVQIVATIGPVSGTQEMLGKLIDGGMDVMRLNFSHGLHDEHAGYITNLRAAALARGVRIPIIQDLSGPRTTTETGHGFDTAKLEITEKDLQDLDFGVAQKVDYIAQSYVGTADDVLAMKEQITRRGAAIPLIAKIERHEAVQAIDSIIAVADAIMIARGDLGESVPLEEIPFIEQVIIEKCNAAGKPVITATQMMLSMVNSETPTRAEVTDVAFAVIEGTDAIMLSEETARGLHPEETVRMMERIALEAERHSAPRTPHSL